MAIRKIGDGEQIVLDQNGTQNAPQPAQTLRKLADDEYITLDQEREVLNPRATSPVYYPEQEVDQSILGHLKEGATDASRRLVGLSSNLLDMAANKVDRIDTGVRSKYYEAVGYPERDPNAIDEISSFDGSNPISRGLRNIADSGSNLERDLAGRTQAMNVQDSVSYEDVKENPISLSTGRFILEQGARSIPEMGVAMIPYVGLPIVMGTTTQNVLEERNVNQGQDANAIPTGDDLKTALVYAAPSAALERLGALGDVAKPLGGTGREITKMSDVPSAMFNSALGEGSTEFVQENLELAGATQGTDVNPTLQDRVDVGIQGALVGGPMGATIRGATETANLAINKPAPLMIEDGRSEQSLGAEPQDQAQTQDDIPVGEVAAVVEAPINRDDLIDAINNDTPIPNQRTIELAQVEIDPALKDQGYLVGADVEQTTNDGEVVDGKIVTAEVIDDELEVTIVDNQGNLKTLFSSDGGIQPIIAPDLNVANPELEVTNQNEDTIVNVPEVDQPATIDQNIAPENPIIEQNQEPDPSLPENMDLERLTAALENINNQAKQTGWNKNLTEYKRKFKKELDTRFPDWDIPTKVAVNDAVQDVNPDPTDAQKEAGNYKKGHVSIKGLSVSIENPKGSIRSGKDKDGNEWQTQLPAHYGYIKGTNGADGDQIDVYIGEKTESDRVFIVDQIDPQTRDFDEVKVMIGYNSQQEALEDYSKAFSDGSGSSRIGAVSEVNVGDFKDWVNTSKSKKAFSYEKIVQDQQTQSVDTVDEYDAPDFALMKQRLDEAINEKSESSLRSYLGNLDNKKSRGYFTKVTGVSLPKTKSGTLKAIDDYLGIDDAKRSEIEATNEKNAFKSKNERTLYFYGQSLSRKKIKDDDDSTISVKEWVDRKINAGYNRVVKRGNQYFIVRDDNAGYSLSAIKGLGKEIRLYAEASIALGNGKVARATKPSENMGSQPDNVQNTLDLRARKSEAQSRTNQENNDSSKPQKTEVSNDVNETNVADIPQTNQEDSGSNDGSQLSNQAEPKTEKPSGEKIEDFGEKLEGAKKDLWNNYKSSLSDELPSDYSQITLAKHFPEPNYEKMIEAGVSIEALATVKALRDQIKSKPRTRGVSYWVSNMSQLRDFANDVLTNGNLLDKFTKEGEKVRQLSGFFETIELYKALGYPAFTKAKGWKVSKSRLSKRIDGELKNVGERWMATEGHSFGSDFDTKEDAINHIRRSIESGNTKQAKKRKVKISVYTMRKDNRIVIGKKVAAGKFIELESGFETGREAVKYLSDNYDDLVAKLNKKKDVPAIRRDVNETRVGEDYRNGENVTPELFTEKFGFRGVQFGNYVEQSRRTEDLNNAYDALTDLSKIIGIPEKAISLDGTLGLAFGARGRGGKNPAAAHYESDQVVINLTKINGAGSLGHEWFHAMDNYFGSKQKGGRYLTDSPMYSVFSAEPIRREVQEAFKGVMDAIRKTDIPKRSKELDKLRTKDYWSTEIEMAARTFESYLIYKSQLNGGNNDYLANIKTQESFEAITGEGTYPYATESELKTIADAFDNLFDVIETKQTESGVAMFSRTNVIKKADGLQSALLNAAKDLKQEKAIGGQYLAMLRKTDGIKDEEIEWIGLDDFLKGKNKISKQEVVDYINDNQVQIEEVVLKGEGDIDELSVQTQYEIIADLLPENDANDVRTNEILDKWYNNPTRDNWAKLSDRLDGFGIEHELTYQDFLTDGMSAETKYDQYTLAGGENYREVLFTLPVQKIDGYRIEQKNAGYVLYDPDGKPINSFHSMLSAQKTLDGLSTISYNSSHFSQKNILAHVRLNDRVDANGKKVLFVEEIQSDWHQEGRKRGYAVQEKDKISPQKYDELTAKAKAELGMVDYLGFESAGQALTAIANEENWSEKWDVSDRPEVIIHVNNWIDARNKSINKGVPDAPFKKSWHEMAFRNIAQMASQGDYDSIAWTSGEIQNERFDLSKQVKQVIVEKYPNSDTLVVKAYDKNDVKVVNESGVKPENLPDYIGKEVSDRALKEIEESSNSIKKADLRGVDLQIGGEGMKGFYDKILVKYANKFGKKYGAKVGVSRIDEGIRDDREILYVLIDGRSGATIDVFDTKEEAEKRQKDNSGSKIKEDRVGSVKGQDVWSLPSLPITDKMREASNSGFALFSKTDNVQNIDRKLSSEMETAINARLNALGWPKSNFRIYDSTSLDQNVTGLDESVEGYYWRGVVHISLNSPDILSTINHEVLHGLKSFGAFTDAEWSTLEKRAPAWRKKYNIDETYGDVMRNQGITNKKTLESKLNEEAIAHAFQDFENKGMIRRLANKAVQFIKAIGDVLRGRKFNMKTAEDVFRAIETGKVGSRISGSPKNSKPQFAKSPKVNTPEFKKWFGDSKVVDKDGKPMVVYHSTTSTKDFDTFLRLSHFGTKEQAIKRIDDIRDNYEPYEDTDPNVAPERIFPVYISMKNPLRIEDSGKQHEVEDYVTELENMDIISRFEADDILQKESEPQRKSALIKYIKAAGYDGFVYDNIFESDGGDSYVVLNSSQVKSVFNEGSFDQNEPSIMYKLSKAKKPALEQASKNLSNIRGLDRSITNDLKKMASIVLHPQQIASLYKEFTPVYNAVIERFKQRESMIHSLSQEIDLYNNLKKDAKNKVHAVLEIGRLSGKTYSTKADGTISVKNEGFNKAIFSSDGDTINLTHTEAAAYIGVRKSMDMAMEKYMETILQDAGLLEKGIKTIQDVEKYRLELKRNGGDPDQVRELKDVLKNMNDVLDAKKRGYVPFKRWGQIGVSVKNKDGDMVHFERIEIPQDAVSKIKRKIKGQSVNKRIGEIPEVSDALDRIMDNYDGAKHDINFFEMNRFDEVSANVDLRSLDVLASSSEMSNDEYQKFRSKIEKEMKKKGFRSHFFKSNDVPGYSDDFERAINDYVVTISSYVSRRMNDTKIEEAVGSVAESGKPALHKYAADYRDYVDNPIEEHSTIRMAAFFWYLSGNISSGVINLTQPFLVTAPWFKATFSHSQIGKAMTKAYADIGGFTDAKAGSKDIIDMNKSQVEVFDFDKAPKDIREALKKAHSEGDFLSMATHDAMAISNSTTQSLRGLSKYQRAIAERIGLTFSIPEKINRIATFIAAYRMALDPRSQAKIKAFIKDDNFAKSMLDGKTGEDLAFAYAELAVVSTQYRVGKLNRPRIGRGIGTLPTQFMSFTIQTFELMYKLGKLHGGNNKASIAAMMLSILAVSGIKGIPFEDDLQDLYEKLHKFATGRDVDIDSKIREALMDYTNDSVFLTETIMKGLPASALNIDLSGRLGFGNVAPDNGSDFLGVWYNLLYERPVKVAEKLNKGDKLGALSEGLPAFIGNPVKAYMWSEDGVRTQRGAKVIDAKDLSDADIALKFFGFTSADISRKRDGLYSERRLSTAVDGLRSRYYSRIAKSIAERKRMYEDGDTEGAEQMSANIQAINDEIRRYNQTAPLHEKIILNETTIKQKFMEEMTGAKAKRTRKQARPRAEEIRRIYGN